MTAEQYIGRLGHPKGNSCTFARFEAISPTMSLACHYYRQLLVGLSGRSKPGYNSLCSVRPLTRDETIYPEPEEFKPERFMGGSRLLDPRQYFYGFGRRYGPRSTYSAQSRSIDFE